MSAPYTTSIALLLKESDLPALYAHYEKERALCANPYVSFFAEGEGYSVLVYSKSHKGDGHKVLFQGEKAKEEAQKWEGLSLEPSLFHFVPKPAILRKDEPSFENFYPQIGSDEVGTGDFFGPVVVVASFMRESDLPRLEELGVTDSKKMSDERIEEIGPLLSKEFPYSALILSDERYNELYGKGENLNSIKAKMHNRCLLNLKSKHPESHAYQDQFAEPSLYYSYLKEEGSVLEGITFKTKGELAFPSVALASVLARYAFLEKMKKMGERYSFAFPFGSSASVDQKAREFVKKHGEKELRKVAKMNFANAAKI